MGLQVKLGFLTERLTMAGQEVRPSGTRTMWPRFSLMVEK